MAHTIEQFVGVKIFFFFLNDVKVMGNLVGVMSPTYGMSLWHGSLFLSAAWGMSRRTSLPTSSCVALPQSWVTVSPSWPQLQVRR